MREARELAEPSGHLNRIGRVVHRVGARQRQVGQARERGEARRHGAERVQVQVQRLEPAQGVDGQYVHLAVRMRRARSDIQDTITSSCDTSQRRLSKH